MIMHLEIIEDDYSHIFEIQDNDSTKLQCVSTKIKQGKDEI